MAPLQVNIEGVSVHVRGREHLPPHIHAFYGDEEVLIDIRTGEIYVGSLPGKKLQIVQDWLNEGDNREEALKEFYLFNPGLRPHNG